MVSSESEYDKLPHDESSKGFRNILEGWEGDNRLHNNIHLFVGGRTGTGDSMVYGDMVLSTSPNDPAFFLHHCFIDKVWAVWQSKWLTSTYVPTNAESDEYLFHRLDDPMHTFFDEKVTPRQMLDVSSEYSYDTIEDITTRNKELRLKKNKPHLFLRQCTSIGVIVWNTIFNNRKCLL